jgi:hypothetical protein
MMNSATLGVYTAENEETLAFVGFVYFCYLALGVEPKETKGRRALTRGRLVRATFCFERDFGKVLAKKDPEYSVESVLGPGILAALAKVAKNTGSV